MSIRIINIIFFITLIFCSCKKSNDQLFDEASTLLKESQFDKAINIYNELIKRNRKLQLAYYNRGYCYFSKNEYKKALLDYNRLIDLQTIGDFVYTENSNSPFASEESKYQVSYYDALYQRAQVYFYLDMVKESFQDFNNLIANNYQEKSNCYLWQGSMWLNSGDTLKACDCFTKSKQFANRPDLEKEAEKFIATNCVKHN